MKCGICRAPLTVRGYSTKNGRRSPVYYPCPRLNDSQAHPARVKRISKEPKGPTPTCPRCNTPEDVVPARNFGRPTGGWHCRRCGWVTWPEEVSKS